MPPPSSHVKTGAAGAGTWLDHDRLAQNFPHLHAKHPGDNIGAGTDHDADRAIGIFLRV